MPTPKKKQTTAKSVGQKVAATKKKPREIEVVQNWVEPESEGWERPSTFKRIEIPDNFDHSAGIRVELKLPEIDSEDELHKELKIIDVASLAAKLLHDDDTYDEAVARAMLLLRAAAKSVTNDRIMRLAIFGELTSLEPRSFKEGVRFITGQNRTDRATVNLQDFWEASGGKDELNKRIAKHEKDGFTVDEMEAEKLAYQQWRKKTP
jgi:hypothetical protein